MRDENDHEHLVVIFLILALLAGWAWLAAL
jgi:hypothetical protein